MKLSRLLVLAGLLVPWLLMAYHADSVAYIKPLPVTGGTVGSGGDHMLQTQAAIRNALNDTLNSFAIDLGSHTGQYGKQGAIDSTTGLTTRLINLSGFSDFTLAFSDSGTGRLRVDWIAIDPTDSTMSTAIDTIYLGQTSVINQITRVKLSAAPAAPWVATPTYGKLWFRCVSGTGGATGGSSLETLGPLIASTPPPPPLGWQDSYFKRSIHPLLYWNQAPGLGPSLDPAGTIDLSAVGSFTTDTITFLGAHGVPGVAARLTYVNSVTAGDAGTALPTHNPAQSTNNVSGNWGTVNGEEDIFFGLLDTGKAKYGVAGEDFIQGDRTDDPWAWLPGGFLGQRSEYDVTIKADTASSKNATQRVGMAAIGFYDDLRYDDFCGAGTKGTKPVHPMLAVYARTSDGTWWVRMARGDSVAFDSVQVSPAPTFTASINAPFYMVHVTYTPARTWVSVARTGEVPAIGAVLDSSMAAYPKPSRQVQVGHIGALNRNEGLGLKLFAHTGNNSGSKLTSLNYVNPVRITYRY